uniref:Uncharacterized protein n=1 Tax=Rhizophora mucronata TaxID=61149 RepID=A0A2P2JTD7_RHIMU
MAGRRKADRRKKKSDGHRRERYRRQQRTTVERERGDNRNRGDPATAEGDPAGTEEIWRQ